MISDDDVMRLFEQADPARRPDRTNDHVAGAGYLTALREQRSIDMTIIESPQTDPRSSTRRRWTIMGTAAAAVAVLIGLLAVAVRDSEPPAPADPPPTAPITSPSEVEEVEIAEQFYAALNGRDLATLQTLMGSDAVSDSIPVEDMPAHLEALDAWDWEWDEVACAPETVDADVRCEIAARNRLTDLTGTELAGYSLLTMTDGTIDRVHLELDFSDYSTNAFMPFATWLSDNHPDDDQTIFGDNDPFRQTPESAALLDQHLTEYVNEVRAEVDIAEQFYASLNDRDLAALQTLMGSDAVYLNDFVVEDLPAHIAALEAWDWEWEVVACAPESVDADVRCEIAVRNRLTELTGTELSGYSLLTMTDGRIGREVVELDFSDYSANALMPFETWLQDYHPDDYQTMNDGDNVTLRQTAESAALLDQRLSEYVDEVRAEADE